MNFAADDGIVVVMSATCDSTTDLVATLRTHFGHPAFRPGQEQLVSAVLSGGDVLAVMPTGSGKSLGYQLPAIVLPGTTLVVSPLISLMKDQVDELSRRGIPSGALHSMLSSDARREVMSAARAGRLRLLYVAPERFASSEFARLLRELTIQRLSSAAGLVATAGRTISTRTISSSSGKSSRASHGRASVMAAEGSWPCSWATRASCRRA